MTAWHMLHTRAGVRAGETVLVSSASSAVGTLAVQIARNAGARVLATTSAAAKVPALRALGAEEVIVGDVRTAVLAATGGAGADVVIEHAGGRSFETSLRCAARGGRVVTCGATAGAEVTVDLWKLFAKEIAILGSVGATRRELNQLLAEVASGRVRPVIAGVFELAEVERAYAALADRERVGKVVVEISRR
jgi:NADPH:quinone reductase-like Zn-dependent oxidoreductase